MDTITSIDDYLNLVLSLNVSANTVLAVFFLSMARIIPIMVFAPFFGAKIVPGSIRIMFSVAIIAILLPGILFSVKQEIPLDLNYAVFFLKELLIGFLLGFLVAIPFNIAQSAGSLTDHMRGAQSLQVTDPTTSSQTGPIGILYNYVLITIFFFIGGPFILIDALNKSFNLIPVTSLINPALLSMKVPFWTLIVGLLNYVLAMAIQLAAPTLIGILMAEMFLGIANRLAPQVQIVFLGISLKSWVGLALLAAAWYFIMQQMSKEAINWLNIVQNTIKLAAP
ncbi:MAG: EscT/YscT/HrcT family type III secretion system export apparatus protein [Parachlamydiales bacterium]|nr:EscT/YscT/HrcT family type III secretion system export apparatus protein [Parachlamydiales bacterium]